MIITNIKEDYLAHQEDRVEEWYKGVFTIQYGG